jgi:hypothetical protein
LPKMLDTPFVKLGARELGEYSQNRESEQSLFALTNHSSSDVRVRELLPLEIILSDECRYKSQSAAARRRRHGANEFLRKCHLELNYPIMQPL